MTKISPSVLAADFTKLGEEVKDIENAGADMVHLDVMDGKFVTNISFGLPVIEALRKKSDMVFDVHLMIDSPEVYIDRFIDAGADIVTFHTEATKDVDGCINIIKNRGKKAAVSVKPNTPIETVYTYLPKCDMVLVMSVFPGFGGQKFIPESLDKLRQVKAIADKLGLDIDIQIDGGVSAENVALVKDAGANVIVAGSAVFKAEDRAKTIAALKA